MVRTKPQLWYNVVRTPKETHMTDIILVHDDNYANWVFDPSHPTQGRRFMLGRDMIRKKAGESMLRLKEIAPRQATREELALVHDKDYLDEVLSGFMCGEWYDQRPDLAELAATFAGGTVVAYEALMRGEAKTAVHLAGAKHHAQRDHSSGFCVFADFAMVAEIATAEGKRVAILDVDAHAGDGTENLTFTNPNVLTMSVHEDGIFPWTGFHDVPALNVYNRPLDPKSGDMDLDAAVEDFARLALEFKPDIILIAAGADGHETDPLSTLKYTPFGYYVALRHVRRQFPDTPILIGGAGGYQPDDWTPYMWSMAMLAAGLPVEVREEVSAS